MKDRDIEDPATGFVLEYDIDAPPQKVWRAVSVPAFRSQWLPDEALASTEATSLTPGREIGFKMRDIDPPFLESVVTFRILHNPTGGTRLQVIHELADTASGRMMTAGNDNNPVMMRVA